MRNHLAILLAVVLWAAAFPAIRAGLAGYGFGHLVLLRFLVASVTLLAIWLARRSPLPESRDIPRIALLGFLGMAVYPAALSFGEIAVAAGTASILVNLSPIFTAIFAASLLGERLTPAAWIGILVAFAGAAAASLGHGTGSGSALGVMAVLAASVIQALQFVLAKSLLRRYDAVSLTIFSVAFGTAFDVVFARGFVDAVRRAPLTATLAVVFLGICSTVIATISWSYALARVPAPYAAAFLYLVTPISILIAAVWLHETPSAWTVAGAVVATLGVALVHNRGLYPLRVVKSHV